MPRVTVSTRAAIRDAVLSLKPSRRDYMGLRRAMMNFILEEVAERHYAAFTAKSNKMADEFRRRWRPLATYTIQKKGHDRIGYETGKMDASFKPGYTTPDGHYIRPHPDQVAEATAHSIKFGTKVTATRKGRVIPYAVFFDRGTRTQPARRFFPRGMKRWVAAGIKKAMPHLARMMGRSR